MKKSYVKSAGLKLVLNKETIRNLSGGQETGAGETGIVGGPSCGTCAATCRPCPDTHADCPSAVSNCYASCPDQNW